MGRTKDIREAIEAELAFDPLVDETDITVVNMDGGRNQPTIAPLQDVLPGIVALDQGYETYPVTAAVGGHRPRRTRPGWTASPRPATNRLAWSRWGVNCSATGPARKPRKASRRFCSVGNSPLAGARSEPAGNGARAGR